MESAHMEMENMNMMAMHMNMMLMGNMMNMNMMVPREEPKPIKKEDSTAKRVYTGTVMNFDAERNSGFIVCDEIKQQHSQDVYYYRNVLEPSGAGVGDEVCFVIHVSPKGLPQAALPVLRLSTPDFALVGTFKAGNAKEFGAGWVECNELAMVFGRDAFVQVEFAVRFHSGQRLAFNCFITGDGLPCVRDAEVVDEAWTPVPGDLTASLSVPGYFGPGKKREGRPDRAERTDRAERDRAEREKDRADRTEYEGAIKAISLQGTFGFIDCSEASARYGRDIFVHVRQVGEKNLKVGTRLKFRVAMNWEEKPHADSCEVLDAPQFSLGMPRDELPQRRQAHEAEAGSAHEDAASDLWARYGMERAAMGSLDPVKRQRTD
uniref:Cold-shock domain-containing protein n=1 Tax=Noctiluca scintillans TaxID=2966 RepID=A0A7S1FI68_NOCSC